MTTPLGTATSTGVFAPTDAAGVVNLFLRHANADPRGDGSPDISEVLVADDGHRLSVVATFSAPLPAAFTADAVVSRFGAADAHWILSRGATDSLVGPASILAAVDGTHLVLSVDLRDVGAYDDDALGRFSIRLAVASGSGSDSWPDASAPAFDARPIFTPRYLRYRAVDPIAAAAAHGAQYMVTAEGTDMSLMKIREGQSLDEAMAEMVVSTDVIGAFPNAMAYATYPAVLVGGGCAVSGAGAVPVDTGTDTKFTQWNFQLQRVTQAWGNTGAGNPRGKGVKVIVADSGVFAGHNEFNSNNLRVDLGRNLLLPFLTAGGPGIDPAGHGTAVASIIVADSSNGGMAGIAPEAAVIPYRVQHGNGVSDGFTFARAFLVAMAAQDRDPSIKVINFSVIETEALVAIAAGVILEFATLNPLWQAAGEAAWAWESQIAKEAAKRFVITASSGNHGDDWLALYGASFPATIEGAIAVGAVVPATATQPVRAWVGTPQDPGGTQPDDVVAIAAAGGARNIMAADNKNANAIICFGGTSASAPQLAGAAAILLSIPGHNLTPAQVRSTLIRTATRLADSPRLVGAGVLNLEAAVGLYSRPSDPVADYGGTTEGSPVLDTTFSANTSLFLLPDGSSIARSPSTLDPFVPISIGGQWGWLTGDSVLSSDGSDTVVVGAIGQRAVKVVALGATSARTVAVLTLPSPSTGKAVVVSGQPLSSGVTPRRALIPVAGGIVSVSLHDAGASLNLTISDPTFDGVFGVRQASLPSSSAKRLAIGIAAFGGSAVRFFTYDVNSDTATNVMATGKIPFTPVSIAVGNAPFGSFASAPAPSATDFPIWATDGAGKGVITGVFQGQSTAEFRSISFGTAALKQLMSSPTRPEIYGYTLDGEFEAFDVRDGLRTLDMGILAQKEVLGNASISHDGTQMAFSDALGHGQLGGSKPPQPTRYYAALLFNL